MIQVIENRDIRIWRYLQIKVRTHFSGRDKEYFCWQYSDRLSDPGHPAKDMKLINHFLINHFLVNELLHSTIFINHVPNVINQIFELY
jgi:hypothetical protein